MATESTTPNDHFTLNKVGPLIASYTPPEVTFEPNGAWKHQYMMYSMGYGQVRPEGELTIQRNVAENDHFQLKILCRRYASHPFSQFVEGELDCMETALASPGSWTYQTKLAQAITDPPYLKSGLTQHAHVRDGCLIVQGDAHQRMFSLQDEYTCKWCLLEAVQRLPREEFEPLEFTVLDDFDQPHPGQTLRFRKQEYVELADGPGLLTAYEQIGPGVLPTVFWVDSNGRCLFLMSCIEIYILEEADGVELNYDDNPMMNLQRRET